MDARTLSEAMGGALPLSRYESLLPAWNECLLEAGCTTVNRSAMIHAQVGEESGGLRWMNEIADGSEYEGRADLGNTRPGDGCRFKGHGPIQITGRDHHTEVSRWAYGKGYVPSPSYFVDHPEDLGSDRFGFLGAVWYWTVARPQLNALCDAGDLIGATRAVNGGTHGLADRQARWDHCRTLGAALLPTNPAPTEENDVQPSDIPAIWGQPVADDYNPRNPGMRADVALGWAVSHAAHANDNASAALKAVQDLTSALKAAKVIP